MRQTKPAPSLAPMFERLDAMNISARDREMAKNYLRKSDAFVEFAFGAWSRMREIISPRRAEVPKSTTDTHLVGNGSGFNS